jgi:hypothetical protein
VLIDFISFEEYNILKDYNETLGNLYIICFMILCMIRNLT